MDIMKKRTNKAAPAGVARFTVEAKMDADEVDIIIWSLEAYYAKGYGQPLQGFVARLLDDLRVAYKMGDKA